jgi:hypothetical protein
MRAKQEQTVISFQNQDSSLRSKITKDPAPKQAKNLNLENQQEMALKRIQDENEHLKLLNK